MEIFLYTFINAVIFVISFVLSRRGLPRAWDKWDTWTASWGASYSLLGVCFLVTGPLFILAPSAFTAWLLNRVFSKAAAIPIMCGAVFSTIVFLTSSDSRYWSAPLIWHACTIFGLILAVGKAEVIHRQQNALCKKCSYPLSNISANVCPECGFALPPRSNVTP